MAASNIPTRIDREGSVSLPIRWPADTRPHWAYVPRLANHALKNNERCAYDMTQQQSSSSSTNVISGIGILCACSQHDLQDLGRPFSLGFLQVRHGSQYTHQQ